MTCAGVAGRRSSPDPPSCGCDPLRTDCRVLPPHCLPRPPPAPRVCPTQPPPPPCRLCASEPCRRNAGASPRHVPRDSGCGRACVGRCGSRGAGWRRGPSTASRPTRPSPSASPAPPAPPTPPSTSPRPRQHPPCPPLAPRSASAGACALAHASTRAGARTGGTGRWHGHVWIHDHTWTLAATSNLNQEVDAARTHTHTHTHTGRPTRKPRPGQAHAKSSTGVVGPGSARPRPHMTGRCAGVGQGRRRLSLLRHGRRDQRGPSSPPPAPARPGLVCPPTPSSHPMRATFSHNARGRARHEHVRERRPRPHHVAPCADSCPVLWWWVGVVAASSAGAAAPAHRHSGGAPPAGAPPPPHAILALHPCTPPLLPPVSTLATFAPSAGVTGEQSSASQAHNLLQLVPGAGRLRGRSRRTSWPSSRPLTTSNSYALLLSLSARSGLVCGTCSAHVPEVL